jgi:pimeloyl-ACP methyl ester carboxylesterase
MSDSAKPPAMKLSRDGIDGGGPILLAYRRRVAVPGIGAPGLVFAHGFRSDMAGQKAEFLDGFAAQRGLAYVRYDAFGHGESDGTFTAGTIGRWAEDLVTVIDELTEGPQILIGSSMGGWLMLLATLKRPERIAALVGIAAAPDFTATLMAPAMTPDQRTAMARDGFIEIPSDYGPPFPITQRLIEDGAEHCVLSRSIPFDGPVRLIHGKADPDVPWTHSVRAMETLDASDARLTLIKDGDHRLSRPQDFAVLAATLDELLSGQYPAASSAVSPSR